MHIYKPDGRIGGDFFDTMTEQWRAEQPPLQRDIDVHENAERTKIGKRRADLRTRPQCTAVTRLARAGCTVPEIASITGHSNADVSSILDQPYLASDPAIAKSAISKLE